MPFTVDDFQDLLRLLEQHPEWRVELRRVILTDELLGLPALVRELAEHLVTLTDRVDALAEAQARTEAQLTALTARVDALAEAQARTEAQFAALVGRVGTLEGDVLELRYARRAPAYFSRLARRLRVVEPAALADLLDDAVQEGRLTEGEREAVLEADLVLAGRRRVDQAEVYLLVEVSAGIGSRDVQRAADRAGVLARLGRPVVPVVAGRRINPEASAQAQALGVWEVLDGQASPPRGA